MESHAECKRATTAHAGMDQRPPQTTLCQLADECNVTIRTVQSDIELLSCQAPIIRFLVQCFYLAFSPPELPKK